MGNLNYASLSTHLSNDLPEKHFRLGVLKGVQRKIGYSRCAPIYGKYRFLRWILDKNPHMTSRSPLYIISNVLWSFYLCILEDDIFCTLERNESNQPYFTTLLQRVPLNNFCACRGKKIVKKYISMCTKISTITLDWSLHTVYKRLYLQLYMQQNW